jgi:hypothetical protein
VFEAQQSHIRTETGTGSGSYDHQQKAPLHPMTYTITKHIKIEHEEDGWSFDFTTDECGTVSVEDGNGPGYQTIHIPKDCIQHFIDVLGQYK